MKYDIELVGKIGSMALINKKDKDINYNIIARIGKFLKPGCMWVTSGAVEIGRLDYITRHGYPLEGLDDDIKTDYSAQGQAILMQLYRQYINSNYSVRQFLVEHQHFNDDEKRKHLQESLIRCVNQKAVPIINYNDAVSYEETTKLEIENLMKENDKVVSCVDNDETASQVACLVKTKRLLILTSVDGIYTDPNDSGTLIEEVNGKDVYELIDNVTNLQDYCSGASRKGANGARAKLEYIKEPLKLGTEVIIANSKYAINDILVGNAPRTLFKVK